MSQPLKPSTAAILTLPPLLWAGNAIVGRMVHDLISPFALNFLRWAIAFMLLLPLAGWVLRRDSAVWPQWRQFALLGLLGIGCYNALLYLALKTSTPLNATLVGSSMPVWMLAVGRICWGIAVSRRQLLGAGLSVLGVAVVLSRGDPQVLRQLQLVPQIAWRRRAHDSFALRVQFLSKNQRDSHDCCMRCCKKRSPARFPSRQCACRPHNGPKHQPRLPRTFRPAADARPSP